MFTGLVEAVQSVVSVVSNSVGKKITIELGHLAQDANLGDSICVNGVCLTISELKGSQAAFDVMQETLKRSTLDGLVGGGKVNLERAMAAGGRFGGHFVQGHIDGTGTINKIQRQSGQCLIYINAAPEIMQYMVSKGSVAIDGVSLTVIESDERQFSVSLIPTTLRETTIGLRQSGDKVNIEADIVSKLICQRMDRMMTDKASKLDINQLRQMGY